jgi:O-antigen/teichoic acid export membrane protein
VDYEEVGFYSNSEKIINICVAFISALGQVMLPKMTNLLANGNTEEFNTLTRKSIKFSSFLSIAMFYGLLGVAQSFIPLFYGPGYEPCIPLLRLLSVNLMFLAWGSVLRSEFLIPKEQNSIFIKSVLLGVVVNLILNILLIPQMKAVGATIGTISAEVSSLIFILIGIRKEFNTKQVAKDALPYFVIGAIMFASVSLVGRLNLPALYLLLCEIITGIVVYLILSFIYWHLTKDEMETTVMTMLSRITGRKSKA